MVIHSLTRVLEDNYAAWQFFELKNTKIVVDGYDFSGHLVNRIKANYTYGGEYLFITAKIQQRLSDVKKCDLEPIFVASGLVHRIGQRLNHRLGRTLKKLGEIQKLNTTSIDNAIDNEDRDFSLPPLWKSVFLAILEKFGWKWTVFKYSCVPACIFLASQLNCPFITSASEYFLIARNKKLHQNTMNLPTHIHVKHLSLNAVTHSNSDDSCSGTCTKFFLPAYKFDHKLSQLEQISDFHLPFLMALFGSDVLPRTRLPDFPQSVINLNSALHPKQTRWIALIKWISLYNPNSTDPIDQFLDCYNPKEQPLEIRKLAEFISSMNYFSVDEMQEVSLLLNFQFPVNMVINGLGNSESQDLNKEEISSINRKTLIDLCHNQDSKLFEPIDFTSHWPHRFVQAFRMGKISPCILTTLYCPGGNVMTQLIEDTSLANSVHDAAFILRLLQYRILTGLEFKLGMHHKLLGLSPHAVEYVRHEDKLVAYEIPVKPLFVDFQTKRVDDLMQEFLDVWSVVESDPPWLFSLAVALSIWFKSLRFTDPNKKSDNFMESAIPLAIGVCAVANYYNLLESSEQVVCDFYLKLQQKLDKDSEGQTTKPGSTRLNLNIVHHFCSLQLVYHSLNSLINILNYLSSENCASTKFIFPPDWIVFPSGELVHYVANDLLTHETTTRYNRIKREWILKLCFMEEHNMQAIKKMQKIAATFDDLVNIANRLSPKIPLIKEYFSTREVDSSRLYQPNLPTTEMTRQRPQNQRNHPNSKSFPNPKIQTPRQNNFGVTTIRNWHRRSMDSDSQSVLSMPSRMQRVERLSDIVPTQLSELANQMNPNATPKQHQYAFASQSHLNRGARRNPSYRRY